MGIQRKMRRKTRKSLHRPKMAMANTYIVINDCMVIIGHPDPNVATKTAKGFGKELGALVKRARCYNLHDMYEASFLIRERMDSGEPLLN